ncbi:uncharacterized protein LOC116601842 [Nematostella vectensis]|uniref:uncharacterized protein LOC116601842 n=1 Tax=Nematostella vectensis TaxID=45351 RepID=UPI0020778C05|nr:uncharacterized protein LOC116601842 [Nematostella vectensis]XP_048578854.1 uncharacterized protein LOC116601842 [Nematostella vectensis]XP_048578855.1 uncharacterized protein LOC116601842 [Nematostella vectensis]XP_048578856.1 uncharacterized protein LOC116601842 [Nematostella vectensis]XP_048578857.1 uncharacterized protein LOC116601842 [Nematostella vectensis]
MWLRVASSNNDPAIVADYFAGCIRMIKGVPRRIRADNGTENVNIEVMQVFLHFGLNDEAAVSNFQYGTSVANQRSWQQMWRYGNLPFSQVPIVQTRKAMVSQTMPWMGTEAEIIIKNRVHRLQLKQIRGGGSTCKKATKNLRLFVVNRADCCGERLDNFEIRIGDSLVNDGNDNPSCGSSYIIPQGRGNTIACHTLLKGRYVNIWIQGPDKVLTLCEVEVYPFIEADHIGKLYSNLLSHALARNITTTLDSGLPLWSCAMQCNTYPGCVYFYYDVTTGICQLSDVTADHAGGLASGCSFAYYERVEFKSIEEF